MKRPALSFLTCLAAFGVACVGSAFAADGATAGDRMVGGLRFGPNSQDQLFTPAADETFGHRTEVLQFESASLGRLSLGSLSTHADRVDPGLLGRSQTAPPGSASKGLALGGYVAYSQSAYSVDLSLRNDGNGPVMGNLGASMGATVPGLPDVNYSVRLAAEWGSGLSSFSPNPLFGGKSQYLESDITSDPNGPDFSLSLSLSHPLTSSLSVQGSAGASRSLDVGFADGYHYRIGAGLGVKF